MIAWRRYPAGAKDIRSAFVILICRCGKELILETRREDLEAAQQTCRCGRVYSVTPPQIMVQQQQRKAGA